MRISLKGVNLGYTEVEKFLMAQTPETKGVQCRCPAMAYIIEHPDGRILWDTGLSARSRDEWPAEWLELVDLDLVQPEVCLEKRLKTLGLGPEDFRYVVMSHLHTDHAGGLRVFDKSDATVVVHEKEFEHVSVIRATAQDFYAKVDFAALDHMTPVLVSGRTVELTSGIRLLSLPGHTPGTMGLLVNLEHTGWVLLASDALYLRENYCEPEADPVIVWQVEQWRESVRWLRKLALKHRALIFPGHDDAAIKQRATDVHYQSIEFWPGYEYA